MKVKLFCDMSNDKTKYNIEDYRFTPTIVYYRRKYLTTSELAKHLNYWCPSIDWEEWAKVGYYNELKNCLQSKLNLEIFCKEK